MVNKYSPENPPTEGICVDGSQLTKTKVTEMRGVITSTKEEIFREKLPFSSINVAEYIGLVRGIQWVIENDPPERVVWCDSLTAIRWYNERKSASNFEAKLMLKADMFLQVMDSELETIEVRHWSKKKIGLENFADFDRK